MAMQNALLLSSKFSFGVTNPKSIAKTPGIHGGARGGITLGLGHRPSCSLGTPSVLHLSSAAAEECHGWSSMVLMDLDRGTTLAAIGILGPFLSAFGFLFVLRIVMSWYPKLPVDKFPYVVAYAPTEPFLAQTRKLIPPLAGVDVTPVVWFGLVSFLNEILVGPQGLLVLLSQKM